MRSGPVFIGVFSTLLAAAGITAAAQQPTTATLITGTLLGAEGRPAKFAQVHLRMPGHRGAIAESTVTPDGGFAIATTATGALYLELSAVDHVAARVPLLISNPRTMELDVRLPRYRYTDSLDQVVAIGDWNKFDFRTGRPLVRQPDGRYTLEVEAAADTVAYQLLHLAPNDGGINGTAGDWYVYDGRGNYRSVFKTANGRATIVFDPALLDRRVDTLQIVFRDPHSRVAHLYDVYRLTAQQSNAYFDTLRIVSAKGDSIRWDWGPRLGETSDRLRREQDPLGRQLLQLHLFRMAAWDRHLDAGLFVRITAEVPPASPWWSFREFQFDVLARLGCLEPEGPDASAEVRCDTIQPTTFPYLERVAQEHPDSSVRADVLAVLAQGYQSRGDDRHAIDYFRRLLAEYPNAPEVEELKDQVFAERVLRAGLNVPEFRFAALGDSTAAYTRESLQGKVYLLEFWATWCEPCVADMPYLHQVYERFRSRGFEILSVAVDDQQDAVTKFRSGRWKMPWLNAFVPGGFDAGVLKRLGVTFLPRAALVDRNGKIIATDGELRGPKLLTAVERALP